MLDILDQVLKAEYRLRPHLAVTPLRLSRPLSEASGAEVHLKLETEQPTGSFKIRGAFSKLVKLQEDGFSGEVVTASTGNHALAVVHALRTLGLKGMVYVPKTISRHKLDQLTEKGASIRFVGDEAVQVERHAREMAAHENKPYISPYNDPQIVGGQGTLALELTQQSEPMDAVFVAVGGGGLVSGIAGYLKAKSPETRIVACQPENSAVMYASVQTGRVVTMDDHATLSDGTAGGIEADTITFEPCRSLVDHWIVVLEQQIRAGINVAFEHHDLVLEGAAGMVVAALLRDAERFQGQRVALVLCGKNIEQERFAEIVGSS